MKQHLDFQVLALTGGTGAGKGAVAAMLAERGVPVLDTDLVSRIVYETGQPCLAALVDAFGEDILDADGCLIRKALAARVFGEEDPDKKAEKLKTLNNIAHRYILAYCRDWLDAQRSAGYPAACIDAPQLFESGFDRECDYIIGVTAKKETRMARIMERDDLTRTQAEQRIASQHDDAFFAAHCHSLLENNGTLSDLVPRVEEILRIRGLSQ